MDKTPSQTMTAAEAAEARVAVLEKVRAAAVCVVPYDFNGDVATTDADMINLAAALAAVEG